MPQDGDDGWVGRGGDGGRAGDGAGESGSERDIRGQGGSKGDRDGHFDDLGYLLSHLAGHFLGYLACHFHCLPHRSGSGEYSRRLARNTRHDQKYDNSINVAKFWGKENIYHYFSLWIVYFTGNSYR